MESNWRFNVWRFGLANRWEHATGAPNGPLDLVTQVQELQRNIVLCSVRGSPGVSVAVGLPLDTGSGYYFFDGHYPGHTGPFPSGWTPVPYEPWAPWVNTDGSLGT